MNAPNKRYAFPSEFLELLRTMPWIEAEELLRDRRTEVLARLHSQDTGAQDRVDLGYVISALNNEIHLISQKMERANWSRSVRAVFGEEGWQRVRDHMVMLEVR